MLRHMTLTLAVFALVPAALAAQQDRDAMIKVAMSAAPPAIAGGATVMDMAGNTLRAGTNGWVCLPDIPSSPGMDPMCLDATWQGWAQAWQNHTMPEVKAVGLAYMLAGGSDASNTDPFATEPAPGHKWIDSGPHVMILLPDMSLADGLPTDPNSGGPYVMWKGTPYAHIMMPAGQK